jgi:hypothetical protein
MMAEEPGPCPRGDDPAARIADLNDPVTYDAAELELRIV